MGIEYRKWPIRYADLWFDEPVDSVDADVVLCHQRSAPLEATRCQPFPTRIIDLAADEQEIFRGFSKETRRLIRKAETQDHLVYEIWMPGEWNQDQLSSFSDFFGTFARTRHIPGIQLRYLSAWARSACIALSRVKYEGVDLAWDSSIVSSGIARALYGGSLQRGRSTDMSQMIGRANRYLTWSNICAFKRFGCKTYDLGGWYSGTEDLEMIGINKFKEQFGGQVVTQFDCVKALTLKGRCYLALKDFRNRIREALHKAMLRAVQGNTARNLST
jgi:lipid II:glycine glycyltransferase (peptidoglycan interpeptide bridge formation enzyme)